MASHYSVEKLHRDVMEIKPQLADLTEKVNAVVASDTSQMQTDICEMKKTIAKFDKYLDAIKPMLSRFGMYTYQDGRTKSIAVITHAFATTGTVDAVVFDCGGSGGTYSVAGKYIGSGADEVQPFLEADIEEEDNAGAGATTAEAAAEPVMAS